MDGLSGAASGMAVVSLALQLAGTIKQLYDFWDSLEGAPDDVRAITTDLGLLSSVLAETASEEQHFGPDPTLTKVLEACCYRINQLADLTNHMEPDFASKSFRIRKWTAFKAVLKGERIQKVQKVLEGMKTTLMLAQQNHHNRLNRLRYQSQRQDLTTITNHLSSLKLEHMSATITTVSNSTSALNDHTNALRGEASRICRTIQNPVERAGIELGSRIAVQDLAGNLSRDQSATSSILTDPKSDHVGPRFDGTSRRSRQQTWTLDSITQNLFGTIITTTEIPLLRSRCTDDNALADENDQYEHESSFRILPAQWLLKLGFNYAYNFSTHDSSTQGWQYCIKPINLVPDDASIFEFCRQGNIEQVRNLISRRLASVRDVNSRGYTALHFAARSRSPELCKYLVEAGADKDARTFEPWNADSPLMQVALRRMNADRLVHVIDTCRIFQDSFDFWDEGEEHGDGWRFLACVVVSNSGQSTAEAKGTLAFLLWSIQSSSWEIKANDSPSQIFNVARYVADLLFELGRPGSIDDLPGTGPFTETAVKETAVKERLLHYYVKRGESHKVKMVLTWGANPHHVHFDNGSSPRAESPLSLAMYNSPTFRSFRDVLHETNPDVDVEEFARQELKQGSPLLDAGWQMKTLCALLELDFEPDSEPESLRVYDWRSCNSCNTIIRLFGAVVQPYWQSILESIKNGTYPQGFCSEISSTMFDETEIWCISCWYEFKETGHRRPRASPAVITETDSSDGDESPEDSFSPFLFNT